MHNLSIIWLSLVNPCSWRIKPYLSFRRPYYLRKKFWSEIAFRPRKHRSWRLNFWKRGDYDSWVPFQVTFQKNSWFRRRPKIYQRVICEISLPNWWEYIGGCSLMARLRKFASLTLRKRLGWYRVSEKPYFGPLKIRNLGNPKSLGDLITQLKNNHSRKEKFGKREFSTIPITALVPLTGQITFWLSHPKKLNYKLLFNWNFEIILNLQAKP